MPIIITEALRLDSSTPGTAVGYPTPELAGSFLHADCVERPLCPECAESVLVVERKCEDGGSAIEPIETAHCTQYHSFQTIPSEWPKAAKAYSNGEEHE